MKRGMKKVMKDEIKLTREELHEARAWAQDESWVKRKKYENDPEYLACVQDILDNPGCFSPWISLFSMDRLPVRLTVSRYLI